MCCVNSSTVTVSEMDTSSGADWKLPTDMSSERSSAGKLFQTEGPWTAKLRSTCVVFVRGTASWRATVMVYLTQCSRWLQTSFFYVGCFPTFSRSAACRRNRNRYAIDWWNRRTAQHQISYALGGLTYTVVQSAAAAAAAARSLPHACRRRGSAWHVLVHRRHPDCNDNYAKWSRVTAGYSRNFTRSVSSWYPRNKCYEDVESTLRESRACRTCCEHVTRMLATFRASRQCQDGLACR